MGNPPVLVVETEPVAGWASTASPKVSPSITVLTNDVLVVIAMAADAATTLPLLPTNSGTALTWTRRQNQTGGGTSPIAIYTATATAAEAITVTVTLIGGTNQWSFGLFQYRGSDGVGASSAGAIAPAAVQPALGLTTTRANSAVISAHADHSAVDAPSRVWNTINGAPMTEALYSFNSATYTAYLGFAPDAGTVGALSVGLTGTGAVTHNWASAAVEIFGATDTAIASAFVSVTADGSIVRGPALPVLRTSARHRAARW